MQDGELVQQALAGRREAYEELVRRWAGRITALCHAKVGCASSADDLAQDAFLRGYRALATLADPAKFGGWLCNIARNACLNWLKEKERTQVPFSILAKDNSPDEMFRAASTPTLDRDEDIDRLKKEVAALPAEYRDVVTLYYHQDVTYRDLADMLDVSVATINARLTKARLMLRERLAPLEPGSLPN